MDIIYYTDINKRWYGFKQVKVYWKVIYTQIYLFAFPIKLLCSCILQILFLTPIYLSSQDCTSVNTCNQIIVISDINKRWYGFKQVKVYWKVIYTQIYLFAFPIKLLCSCILQILFLTPIYLSSQDCTSVNTCNQIIVILST